MLAAFFDLDFDLWCFLATTLCTCFLWALACDFLALAVAATAGATEGSDWEWANRAKADSMVPITKDCNFIGFLKWG